MTPKQRFEASIGFRQPDGMVSMMELGFHLFGELTGIEPVAGYEYAALNAPGKQRALEHNAELFVRVAEECGHDVIRGIGGYWELSPGLPAYLWLPDRQARLDQIRAIKKAAGDKYFILGQHTATMGMPNSDRVEEFVYDLFDRPDEVKARNEGLLLDAVEFQERMLDAGADGILNSCDVAYKTGPFISPAMMDEFFFPYLRRWADSLNKQSVISIWHTDGNLMPVMGRILDSGISALQCVDPLAGMDIVELKKLAAGKLALIGNIDCGLLQFGPADAITAEVRRVVEGCKHGGGFVLSGCNAIFKGIPIEHYLAYCKARVEYGRF